jgi:hypothetical protein
MSKELLDPSFSRETIVPRIFYKKSKGLKGLLFSTNNCSKDLLQKVKRVVGSFFFSRNNCSKDLLQKVKRVVGSFFSQQTIVPRFCYRKLKELLDPFSREIIVARICYKKSKGLKGFLFSTNNCCKDMLQKVKRLERFSFLNKQLFQGSVTES